MAGTAFRPKVLCVTVCAAIILVAPTLTIAVSGQTLNAAPACGIAAVTKVCLTGTGWAEPSPPCRYTFAFDAATVAPDQQDGLFGPPKASFVVPAGAAPGDHSIVVKLLRNSDNALLQQKSIPFKVVAPGASATGSHSVGAASGGSGESITMTYEPSENCENSCKKIVFIQTVSRFAVDDMGNVLATKSSDWPGFDPDGKKTAVETAAGRRIDQYPGLSSPYYNQNNGLVSAGSNDGAGQVGSAGSPPQHDATLFDQPNTPASFFPTTIAGTAVTIASTILRFEAAPFCAEGDDAGKFLGKVVTWEHHQAAGATGTIENVSISDGTPSAAYMAALSKWVATKGFSLPTAKPPMCQ